MRHDHGDSVLAGAMRAPPTGAVPKVAIDPMRYEWTRLHGADAIRSYHERHGPRYELARLVGEIPEVSSNEHGQFARYVTGYGDRYVETREVWLYEDGHALVGSFISDWGGTFASNDEATLKVFALAPLSEAAAERQLRHNASRRYGRRRP
jgi:hypothetical protein